MLWRSLCEGLCKSFNTWLPNWNNSIKAGLGPENEYFKIGHRPKSGAKRDEDTFFSWFILLRLWTIWKHWNIPKGIVPPSSNSVRTFNYYFFLNTFALKKKTELFKVNETFQYVPPIYKNHFIFFLCRDQPPSWMSTGSFHRRTKHPRKLKPNTSACTSFSQSLLEFPTSSVGLSTMRFVS